MSKERIGWHRRFEVDVSLAKDRADQWSYRAMVWGTEVGNGSGFDEERDAIQAAANVVLLAVTEALLNE